MSVFRSTLEFFGEIGVYDVVLPFLLVFTIVFAILEKTRVFGVVNIEGTDYTKKNLNAMVAFVAAFFIVASTQLVAIISEVVANTVLLLIVIIMFLLLAGSFNKDEEFYLKGGWHKLFMVIAFIAIILIFLQAAGWLQFAYGYVGLYWNSVMVSSLILIIAMVLLMYWITMNPKGSKKKEGS